MWNSPKLLSASKTGSTSFLTQIIDAEVIRSGRNIFNRMLIYPQTFKVIFGDGMIGYVIGDSDMITGFKLVGVEGVEVTSANEAREALNRVLTRKDVGNHNYQRIEFSTRRISPCGS